MLYGLHFNIEITISLFVSFFFFYLQHPESTLEVETKQVMMHNVSSLPLTFVLQASYPFQLLVEDPRWAPVNVKSSQSVRQRAFIREHFTRAK